MNAKLISVKTTRRLYLTNSDASWDDWLGYPTATVEVGEKVDVLVTNYDDGRIYYTAFRFVGKDLYTTTTMRDADGSLHPGCGDGAVARMHVRKAVNGDFSFCKW